MEKIRCAVIDDEPLALGLMASYVKNSFLRVGRFL